MGKIIEKFISVSFIPIIVLNIFGSIIGAIWLIILGEWKLVLGAFFVSVWFSFMYSIIMLVQIPLAGLLNYFMEKKQKALSAITEFITMLIGHGIGLA